MNKSKETRVVADTWRYSSGPLIPNSATAAFNSLCLLQTCFNIVTFRKWLTQPHNDSVHVAIYIPDALSKTVRDHALGSLYFKNLTLLGFLKSTKILVLHLDTTLDIWLP